MTGRRPKHPDDLARGNRTYFNASNNRLRKLRLKNRHELKALLNALVDDYESTLEQPEPASKEG